MQPRKNYRTVATNEQGFASIVIALTLIIVLALLTVGFAQLARREQQSALDKQLANQAYYAAESGINDAAKDIESGAICDGSIKITATCSTATTTDASPAQCMTKTGSSSGTGLGGPVAGLPASALSADQTIDTQNGVSYSCLLVNLTPSVLQFSGTPPGSGQNLAFATTTPLANLTIQWGSFNGNNSKFPASTTYAPGAFPPLSTWQTAQYPPAVLFTLTPAGPGAISRSSLVNSSFNVNLYPAKDTGGYGPPGPAPTHSTQVGYDTNKQGQIVPGNCGNDGSANYPCSVTITGLGGSNFVLYYTPYYDDVNLYITGTTSSGMPVKFIGQAQIDVTGKAHNVLKRLQEVLKANGTNGSIGTAPILPNGALAGQNICKRPQTRPGNTDFINPTGTTVDSGSDPCNLDN